MPQSHTLNTETIIRNYNCESLYNKWSKNCQIPLFYSHFKIKTHQWWSYCLNFTTQHSDSFYFQKYNDIVVKQPTVDAVSCMQMALMNVDLHKDVATPSCGCCATSSVRFMLLHSRFPLELRGLTQTTEKGVSTYLWPYSLHTVQ